MLFANTVILALFTVTQAAAGAFETGILSQRDLSLNYYEGNITKGRGYWHELETVLRDPNAKDTPMINFDENWTRQSVAVNLAPDAAVFALKKFGLNSNQKFLSVTAQLRTHSRIYYSNAMSPSIGMIIAKNNYGRSVDPHTGVVTSAPDRWSAVIWYLWNWSLKQAGKASAQLEYVFQNSIINPATVQTLDSAMAAGKRKMTDKDGNPVTTTWTLSDDEFYAALSTPNGVGVVNLMKSYPVGTGWKTISAISVFWFHGSPSMLFRLESFCG